MNILLISIGAAFGAICRWQLGVWLNPLLQAVSFGTFFANVLGCLLIGMTMGLNLQDGQKLLLITGFLGSFTTFSAFSAEIVDKLIQEKWLNAAMVFGLHTIGGLCATIIGVWGTRLATSGRF